MGRLAGFTYRQVTRKLRRLGFAGQSFRVRRCGAIVVPNPGISQ